MITRTISRQLAICQLNSARRRRRLLGVCALFVATHCFSQDPIILVGSWASKDAPVIIVPDGKPYIADGHHTTAGYLAPLSPVRQLVSGKNRVILGHVLGNYYDAIAGPQPVTDAWWTARAADNQALFYGPEGAHL